MVGQEEQEFDDTPIASTCGKLLSEDDLEVGMVVCAHNVKSLPNEPAPILGQSLEIKAICLPFFVATVLSDADVPTVTLDTRFLSFMKVSKEFAEAQQAAFKVMRQQQQQPMVQPKQPKG